MYSLYCLYDLTHGREMSSYLACLGLHRTAMPCNYYYQFNLNKNSTYNVKHLNYAISALQYIKLYIVSYQKCMMYCTVT